MRYLKRLFVLFTVVMCTACAVVYTYEGKQYRSKQEFLSAADAARRDAVATVVPLPAPVTSRVLLFAVPTPAAILHDSIRNYTKLKGAAPVGVQLEMFTTLAESASGGIRGFYDGAVRRNIYKNVELLEVDSLMTNPAPSANQDVVFYNEISPGSGQWYYATAKGGKQVFAFDRLQPGPAGKVRAFNEALQLEAIKD
jgi:hypothetical protein